ncbi:MAG: cyclic nucleotide-binding domain-containing protein [Treponema sp.]|nr:cyclic nucleotide-binding domain-containing protein [Treponema sp.]
MGKSQFGIDPSPIQNAELFSGLLKGEKEFVISHSGLIQLRKGGRLFSPGQKAEHFYMLLEGSIRVYRLRDDGDEDEMAHFTPGDTIGDFDFARNAAYDAFAVAAEDSNLAMFPGYGLKMDDFVLEEPHIISRILLSSIVMMTGRIKSIRRILVENFSWVQELHRRAYEDPGTGLWKQAFLTDEINRILEDPMAFIMCKPDRFKILVDSRGHAAGDEAMVRIAMVLKKIARRHGRGWSLRFKSNETGLLISKCDASQAEKIADELHKSIASLAPVPAAKGVPAFPFSATVSWAVWPQDNHVWDDLFQGVYDQLLNSWRSGGDTVIHCRNIPSKPAGQGSALAELPPGKEN